MLPVTHTARPFRAGVVRPAPRDACAPRVKAPPGFHSLVLLPGFCNAATDYTAPSGGEEALVDVLKVRGEGVERVGEGSRREVSRARARNETRMRFRP